MADAGRGGGRADEELANVLERNIEALLARRRAEERRQSRTDRVAAAIGRFAGSMTFVYLHLAVFGAWVLANAGVLPVPRFDPDFVKLATFASAEAIFISTFVLVMQNRMATQADKRADLDLQVSLLAEHEVTRLIRLVAAIAERLGVDESRSPDLPELERDVDPERVLDRIERAEEKAGERERPGA
ncbi:DUF1003 domain-containing protein [Anaeromyxobacter oryzae]|uniref:Membrane protein n=1 Tax=Anaeromyxobacter oryzae TaxID=2918170 RepID=A0ABM7WWA2_9BACT|nr:DUF1003 domain-containing protein [Anaeromyxobacter oryzae]BDG03709.1 membrane protein [Anaeromyxobacter oryzae]